MSVGVVDLDNTKLSRTITRWADATENITITGRYQSFAEARRALEDDSIDGFIYIPRRFAADIKRGGDAKVFMDIVHGDSLADAARLAVGSASAELRLRAVAGDKYVYANSVTGGRIGRTLITYVDVTDIRLARTQLEAYAHNLEGEVRRKNSEIIAAERRASVGETALMVGHDLRNPLQALLNSVFLFRSVMERAPEQVLAFMSPSSGRGVPTPFWKNARIIR